MDAKFLLKSSSFIEVEFLSRLGCRLWLELLKINSISDERCGRLALDSLSNAVVISEKGLEIVQLHELLQGPARSRQILDSCRRRLSLLDKVGYLQCRRNIQITSIPRILLANNQQELCQEVITNT